MIPGGRDGLRGSRRVPRRFSCPRMMMRMAVGMHVLRGAGCVLVNNAPAVLVFGQAWCRTRGARECKG